MWTKHTWPSLFNSHLCPPTESGLETLISGLNYRLQDCSHLVIEMLSASYQVLWQSHFRFWPPSLLTGSLSHKCAPSMFGNFLFFACPSLCKDLLDWQESPVWWSMCSKAQSKHSKSWLSSDLCIFVPFWTGFGGGYCCRWNCSKLFPQLSLLGWPGLPLRPQFIAKKIAGSISTFPKNNTVRAEICKLQNGKPWRLFLA